MKKLRLLLAGALASAATLLSPLAAQAAPVTWNLQNTTFSDGSTATGQFVYDAAINAYSAWEIKLLTADHYAFWIFEAPTSGLYSGSASTIVLTTADFEYIINFIFSQPLTDAGGTRSLQGAYAGLFGVYTVTGGSITAADPVAVPEPATLWVAGLGLMGLGFVRRRRGRSAGRDE